MTVSDHATMTVMPPDPYEDVYLGALCTGMEMNDISIALCGACPVKERCRSLHEDLQFGTLIRGAEMDVPLTGVWGGIDYQVVNRAFTRNGERWPAEDRPARKEWA